MLKPVVLTDNDVVWGDKALDLLPEYDNIPQEFKNGNTKWNKLFNDWFFNGIKVIAYYPKSGINREDAMREIQCIMKSFSPKHEHKEAGIAYMLSEFFDNIEYELA